MGHIQPILNDPIYAGRVRSIDHPDNLPERWLGTPIHNLIKSENFGLPIKAAGRPELLICTCIEFRYALPIPAMYAYVIRRASGRLIGSEFSIAYVLANGVRHLALIGHDDCGMSKVSTAKRGMIAALVDQGWDRDRAEDFVAVQSSRYSMEDELDALEREYIRLKRLFRKLEIAPLFVSLADRMLYVPVWYDKLDGGAVPASTNLVPDEDLLTLS